MKRKNAERMVWMTDPLFLGIDLGTTNGKVACWDVSGKLQVEAHRQYPTYYLAPGRVEQDPADWIQILIECLHEVAARLGESKKYIEGIALSTFGPGLVLSDDDGHPLLRCPTWQDDRCKGHGERLIREVGKAWIGLGAPLTGFPARVLWAVEEVPELAMNAQKFLDIKGFIMLWLTGQAVTDPSSGPGRLEWFDPALDVCGVSTDRLARVIPATASAGVLRDELAKYLNLPVGIPVYAGLNDGASATVGSGVTRPGQGIVTLATNGVARVVVSRRLDSEVIFQRHLFSWPFVEDRWICGGFTYSGAGSLQWFIKMMGFPDQEASYKQLLREADAVPIGSKGIFFLPYLAGRGTPEADPNLRGGFLGLRIDHERAELTRSILEGLSYSLREVYEEFIRQGISVESIHLTGGGARSSLWRQIIADLMNQPVIWAGGDSTLGCAIIAAIGSGIYCDLDTACEEMVHTHSEASPKIENAQAYEDLFKSFQNSRDALLMN
jgi:xylulokinase